MAFFMMCGRIAAASEHASTCVVNLRTGSSDWRVSSHAIAAAAIQACSSAPQVNASAACSMRGSVWRAIARARSLSICVGRIVMWGMAIIGERGASQKFHILAGREARTLMEYLVRFLVGGIVVSAFAVISDVLRPKSFAGLFCAAPSLALATLR